MILIYYAIAMKTRVKKIECSDGTMDYKVEYRQMGFLWANYRLVNMKKDEIRGGYYSYEGPMVEYRTGTQKEATCTSTWLNFGNTMCGLCNGEVVYLFLDEIENNGNFLYKGSENIKEALEAYKKRYRILGHERNRQK